MQHSTPIASSSTLHAPDLADLKRKSVRGGAVAFASQGASIFLQLVSTIILARLLSPDDYGVMAMVLAVTSFAGLFLGSGLSYATIQKENLTKAQQSNLFWVNFAVGLMLTLIVASISPLVAWFYHKPELLWVTIALSSTFLIGSLSAQSNALLVRKMWFGRQAVATITGALVTLFVSVVLALEGFRYWSLVWGQIAGGAASTLLSCALSPFRPGLASRGTGLKEMLKFGAHITAFDFVNYFHRNFDNILIGRVWGAGPLGMYSRAYSLLMFPIFAIRIPINAVSLPTMSRLQNHPEQLRSCCRKVTSLIAFISMPLVAFLGVTAHQTIRVALGPGWEESAPLFMILSVAAFVQPVSTIRGGVMLSAGRADRYLRWGIANAIVTMIAFIIGVHWGARGVAIAYAIANTVIFYPSIVYALDGTPVLMQDFFLPLLQPAVASLLAAGVLFLKDWRMAPLQSATVPLLLLDLLIYVATFLGIVMLSSSGRRDLRLHLDHFRIMFSRKQIPSPS